MMKIVVFLNGDRGVSVLKSILESARYSILSIITPHLFKDELLFFSKNIPHFKSKNVNTSETIEYLKSLNADLFLIAGYSDIFKKEIIKIPKRGTLNLHAGKLPEYRGGSPLNWQIINGETQAGLSVILIDEGIDTGDIVSETVIPIGNSDTIRDLHDLANKEFPKITLEALDRINSDTINFKKQDNSKACYWHQRSDHDGFLDFKEMSALEIYNKVRAISTPYPGAWCYREKQKIRVLSCEIADLKIRGTQGKVCYLNSDGPFVICKSGIIKLTSYFFENFNDKLIHGNVLDLLK